MLVGRHGGCGLQVDHASCSRFHAAFVNAAPADDDTCVVVDLGTQHGTFVHRKTLRKPFRLEPFVFYHVEKRGEPRSNQPMTQNLAKPSLPNPNLAKPSLQRRRRGPVRRVVETVARCVKIKHWVCQGQGARSTLCAKHMHILTQVSHYRRPPAPAA